MQLNILFSCLSLAGIVQAASRNCPLSCRCHMVNDLLYVGCENRGLVNVDVGELPSAEWLRLSNNSISALYNYQFVAMMLDKVMILELDRNSINYIERNAFSRMQSLSRLNLSFNRIKNLHPHTFKSTKNLVILNLSYNPLEALHYPFLIAPSIQVVALRSCDLSYVSPGAFTGMLSLTELDLSNNKLVNVNPVTFKHLPYLQSLVITGNEVQVDPASQLLPYLFKSIIYKSRIEYEDLPFNTIYAVEHTVHHNIEPNQNQNEAENSDCDSDETNDPNYDYKILEPSTKINTARNSEPDSNTNNVFGILEAADNHAEPPEILDVLEIISEIFPVLILDSIILTCFIILCWCFALCKRCYKKRNIAEVQYPVQQTFKPTTAPVNYNAPPPRYYQLYSLSSEKETK